MLLGQVRMNARTGRSLYTLRGYNKDNLNPFSAKTIFAKKKFSLNCYSEESFYAREISLETFFLDK